MSTPQDNTQGMGQFGLPGSSFREEETPVIPPAHLPLLNRQHAPTLPSLPQLPVAGQQGASSPARASAPRPGTSLNITGRHQAPPFVTGGQHSSLFWGSGQDKQHEQYESALFPDTSKQSNSQFRLPMLSMPSLPALPTTGAPPLRPETDRQNVPFAQPDTGRYGASQWQSPPDTGRQSISQWQSPFVPPVTGQQSVSPAWLAASAGSRPTGTPPSYYAPAAPPVSAPMTDHHSTPLTSPAQQPVRKRSAGRAVIIINVVLALLLAAGGLSAWMLTHRISPLQILQIQKQSSPQSDKSSTPISSAPALNSITNNQQISPLLFGTNMGLYNADDPLLRSAQTRQLLKEIGVRAIRMPTRSTLSDQTEIAAAQAIKEIGAVPLVVLAGPEFQGPILQTDQHMLSLMAQVFGKETVYYEFGNESDLAGISEQTYAMVWNEVIPVLKQQFPTARFIGPANYQFNRNYLSAFLQQANPLPDGISWHEYACSIHWSAQVCLENIDAWNVHFVQARAAMQEAIGKQLPIWITEWNYASDTNGQLVNDGKSNNPAFMQAWTQKAMQTLVANRVFAAMQYFATDAPMPLVSNNKIAIEGQIFQQEYKQVMVKGVTPPMATLTFPTPSRTVNPQDAFSFEDGTTDGWQAVGYGITQPVNSTAMAFDGLHSLQFTLLNASEEDTPFIAVDATKLPNAPKAGQTLTAYLYVVNKNALVNAKIFVANPQGSWIFANSLTLTPGHWNKIWLGMPVDYSDQVTQIGIQFFTSSPGVSTEVYLDSVGWQ